MKKLILISLLTMTTSAMADSARYLGLYKFWSVSQKPMWNQIVGKWILIESAGNDNCGAKLVADPTGVKNPDGSVKTLVFSFPTGAPGMTVDQFNIGSDERDQDRQDIEINEPQFGEFLYDQGGHIDLNGNWMHSCRVDLKDKDLMYCGLTLILIDTPDPKHCTSQRQGQIDVYKRVTSQSSL